MDDARKSREDAGIALARHKGQCPWAAVSKVPRSVSGSRVTSYVANEVILTFQLLELGSRSLNQRPVAEASGSMLFSLESSSETPERAFQRLQALAKLIDELGGRITLRSSLGLGPALSSCSTSSVRKTWLASLTFFRGIALGAVRNSPTFLLQEQEVLRPAT